MKIYEERKLNSMYLLHNLQKVGNLKEGMEIIISTEKIYYYTNSKQYNIFGEDYNINNIVPFVKEINFDKNNSIPDFINTITSLDNILGTSVLKFKKINDVKCLILTLSKMMVNNIKTIFEEEDFIIFDNVSLTKYGGEIDNNTITNISKTVAIFPYRTKIHTDEEIETFYGEIVQKILNKKMIVEDLINGKEVPSTQGRVWVKNGIEEELKQLSDIIKNLEESENKILAIKIIFSSLAKTPFKILKLIGVDFSKDNNGIITRIFS